MKYFSYAIVIVLVLLGITFAVLNRDTVTVHYYTGNRAMPLSLAMAISFAIGIILGLFVMLPKVLRLRMRNRSLNKKLKNKSKEIDNLRKIPVDDHL